MRVRILMPILVLLVVFCGALGFTVYSNISSSTYELLNKQIGNTLRVVENEIIQAQNTQGALRDADVQKIVEGLSVADGGVFVVNAAGEVIADTQQILTGQNVTSHDWYKEATQSLTARFSAPYGQAQVYAHSVILDGRLVVSYLSSQKIEGLMQTPLYVIGVLGLISITIMGILLYFILTKLFINPMESLEEQCQGLQEGQQIDLKPLKGCPEIVATARQINELLIQQKTSEAQDPLAHNQTVMTQSALSAATSNTEPPSTAALSVVQSSAFAGEPSASFEPLATLREIFEQHRETVAAKKLKFSVRVDKKVPKIVSASKTEFVKKLNDLLTETLQEATPSAKVEVMVSFLSSEQANDGLGGSILFTVRFDEYEDTLHFEVKRG